jgi:hypothetical protein
VRVKRVETRLRCSGCRVDAEPAPLSRQDREQRIGTGAATRGEEIQGLDDVSEEQRMDQAVLTDRHAWHVVPSVGRKLEAKGRK